MICRFVTDVESHTVDQDSRVLPLHDIWSSSFSVLHFCGIYKVLLLKNVLKKVMGYIKIGYTHKLCLTVRKGKPRSTTLRCVFLDISLATFLGCQSYICLELFLTAFVPLLVVNNPVQKVVSRHFCLGQTTLSYPREDRVYCKLQ